MILVSTEEPWTIGRLLEWTDGFLRKKGCESPRLETQMLLAHVFGCKRIDLYTRFDEVASDEARQKFRELVLRRVEGCPVAHLVGHKDFYAMEFEVTPAVLVPRADTETLVDEALRLAKPLSEPHVLDVGTGSGCIAVTLAHRHKGARLTAVDVSPEALAVAARNAARHGASDRIRFLEGDLFSSIPAGERFDLVVSNPPYVPHAEIARLAREVRDHEPRLALDGGPDGFAVIDRLLAASPAYLKPGAHLLLEIGADQKAAALARVADHPDYEAVKVIDDRAGRPRVLSARRKPGT
jgi:release factor glutamine methyltransferase